MLAVINTQGNFDMELLAIIFTIFISTAIGAMAGYESGKHDANR